LNSRYPDNWQEIALKLKQQAHWKCQKCGMDCLKPNENTKGLSKSERSKRTLTVHHQNYLPEDNRTENLICLCTSCHLSYHTRKRGSISVNQLSIDLYDMDK
jgi:predicted HNH restriction endonuclease